MTEDDLFGIQATVAADTEEQAHRAMEALSRVATGLALEGLQVTIVVQRVARADVTP